jgi:hypothetical protein
LPRSEKTAATPQALVPDDDRSGPTPAFDAEAYNTVARAAKLQRIALYRSNFVVLPDYFLSMDDEKAPKPGYSGSFGGYYFDAESGRATCEWKWRIIVSEKRKKTLTIDVVYLIIYGGLQNFTEDNVVRYMRRVGRFASYPYFRAHVSQLNWEAGTNLPILPTIST